MQGLSDDGERVFALTRSPMLPEDTSMSWDIYDYSPAGTERLTAGMDSSEFIHRLKFTPDGTHVFLETRAALTADDSDDQLDVFRRAAGRLTLMSVNESGNSIRPARLAGFSGDGSRVFFETAERLNLADTDDYNDVYSRSDSETALLSGSGEFGPGASFLGATPDGLRVFFKTAESLSPVDKDSSEDVYESHAGEITLLSAGGTPTPGRITVDWGSVSADGGNVFFLTDERLVSANQDEQADIYAARFATGAPPPPGSVPPPPPPPPPVKVFTLNLGLKNRYRLRLLLRGSLAVPVRCSTRCTARVTLTLGRRPARKLGLSGAGDVVLGRRTVVLASAETVSIRVPLAKRVVKRLRKARAVRLKVEVTATDGAGHRIASTRRILARR